MRQSIGILFVLLVLLLFFPLLNPEGNSAEVEQFVWGEGPSARLVTQVNPTVPGTEVTARLKNKAKDPASAAATKQSETNTVTPHTGKKTVDQKSGSSGKQAVVGKKAPAPGNVPATRTSGGAAHAQVNKSAPRQKQATVKKNTPAGKSVSAQKAAVAAGKKSAAAKPAVTKRPATKGGPRQSGRASASQRYVTIDFNDVDINVFIKYISELSQKNFVVDRAVKGKVTIISPSRISEEDAYRVFESVLEVNGFTTVPSGSIIKIVPAVQARSKSIPTIRRMQSEYPDDKIVTQIIPLRYSDPNTLKKLIAPLVSKTSVVIAHAESGLLIITDVLSNISRLQEIIRAVDVPSIDEELVILKLKYASANTVSKSIGQLFLRPTKKGIRSSKIKIIPYERTNSLIIFAPKAQIRKIRNLLVQLDTEVPRGSGKIHVYHLQNADAEEMVKVLTSLPGKKAGTVKDAKKAPPISTASKIMADPETNSLIITAPREEYLVLADVIKKLDTPRRMVYIEALIMEVSVSSEFSVGVKWGGGGAFDDGTGIIGGSFGGRDGANVGVTDGLALAPGFSFGVIKQGIKIGNVIFPSIGAVLKAYKDDSDINIIATPQILTTDNKKARINVGENIPYLTSANTTASNNDYSNYEYKDVGTTLEITPQINQADLVRLEIGVEVTKVKTANEDKPTTFKRTADTTVVVHNEETVVIGGIIGQDTSSSEYKVPLLGDIPVLGWLFKTQGDNLKKTNMFIFITPHIVENQAELAEIYYKKRDVMEYVQEGSSEIPDRFFYGKSNPAHANALTDLGFARLEKGDYEKAREYFEQALKINPDNPYALVNLGVVCEREGDLDGAREMYDRVLRLKAGGEEQVEGSDAAVRQVARDNLEQLGNLPDDVDQGQEEQDSP